uniref:Troponin T n=1 Tax=Caenorhabditis tropicalis TaxID=1561998 RepID=A0A1I7V454_9PELO
MKRNHKGQIRWESREGSSRAHRQDQEEQRQDEPYLQKGERLSSRWRDELPKKVVDEMDVRLAYKKLELIRKERAKMEKDTADRKKHGTIKLFFEENLWRKKYRKHPDFEASVEQLSRIKKLNGEEAEAQLLDLLVKTTFVESHLTVNGQQNVKELFERMRFPNRKENVEPQQEIPKLNLDHEMISDSDESEKEEGELSCSDEEEDVPERHRESYEQSIPFTSPEELSEFLHSMIPVFIIRPATRKWRNSGVQTRVYCQWLKKRIEKRKVVSLDKFKKE